MGGDGGVAAEGVRGGFAGVEDQTARVGDGGEERDKVEIWGWERPDIGAEFACEEGVPGCEAVVFGLGVADVEI